MQFGANSVSRGDGNDPHDRQMPHRLTPHSSFPPEMEIRELELADLIDVPALQSLMDDFYLPVKQV